MYSRWAGAVFFWHAHKGLISLSPTEFTNGYTRPVPHWEKIVLWENPPPWFLNWGFLSSGDKIPNPGTRVVVLPTAALVILTTRVRFPAL